MVGARVSPRVCGFRGCSGLVWPGQDVVGRVRSRVRISASRWCSGGRRRVRAPTWRTRWAGTRIRRWRRVAIMAWPPVTVQVRPQLGQHGDYHPGSARHVIPTNSVCGSCQHSAGRALCETPTRPTPLPVGPVTIAPPDCPRCLRHLRSITERYGRAFEDPPPTPPTRRTTPLGDAVPPDRPARARAGCHGRLPRSLRTGSRCAAPPP
jgi:hypothetical protein